MRSIFLSILYWVFAMASFAQSYHSRLYTEKDGLSSNYINSMVVDKEGFLWLATASGLNRFDGNAFEKFYNRLSDTSSIADNTIQKLFIDSKNRLWAGTNAGISLYHDKTHSFSNYAPDTNILHQQGLTYQAITDDKENNIWVGTKNDLLVFNPESKKFTSSGWAAFAETVIAPNSNKLRVIILGLLKKNKDELWVLSTSGLFSVNTQTKVFRFYNHQPGGDFFGIHLDYADENGKVWMSTYGGGIICFNSTSGTWESFDPPKKFASLFSANSIIQYNGDTLMYTAGNSLFLFDASQKKPLTSIKLFDSSSTKNYTSAEGRSILRYHNMLWIGTNMGLIRMETLDNPIHFVSLTAGDETGRVFKLNNGDGFLYTNARENFTAYLKKNGQPAQPFLDVTGRKIQSEYLYITPAGNGDYYLNDEEHLYRYNVSANTCTAIALPPKINPQTGYDIRNIVVDKQGTAWIRSFSQGILKYEAPYNKLVFDSTLPHKPNKEINALYYDSLTNRLWYAQEFDGLYAYDISTKRSFHYGLNKPPSQRNAAIIYIAGDGKGHIWFSDLQSGLIEYNASANSFIRYTENDGLSSNNCWWSVYSADDKLWINTANGLCEYIPSQKQFISYKEGDGYPVKDNAFLTTDEEGNIYMPYRNGYYTWGSDAFKMPDKSGRIYLRDAMLFNQHLPVDSAYSFSYNENTVQFLFGLLSFDNRDAVIIEYSLNGSSWISADIHSYISFAHLSPGKYELSIRMKNENTPFTHIRFVIRRPFWQQWWFLLLMASILTIGITLVVRRRMKRFSKEALLQQQVMESQMSALRSQMNPHFIFNTLNSINSYIIENKKDEASDYLTDFSKLMRIILEHSQKSTVPLNEELDALKLYLELESKRLESVFDYSISISRDIDTKTIMIPPLIIQPFAENAIWHGLREKKTGGHIEITVKEYEEGILITVQDDGIGRKAAGKIEKVKESNSFGTAATMQRIQLNDPRSKVEIEDLYTKEGLASGTRVNIYLYHNLS